MSGATKGRYVDATGTAHYPVIGVDANGNLKLAGYSAASGAARMEELNPISWQFITETITDVTNGADGTYYYYIDMNGSRKLGLQLELSGGSGTVTVTVEASLQDDGTDPASCTYQDVSNQVFGAASWTSNAMLFDNTEMLSMAKYVRVKVVASTGGANDADWTIWSKRLY